MFNLATLPVRRLGAASPPSAAERPTCWDGSGSTASRCLSSRPGRSRQRSRRTTRPAYLPDHPWHWHRRRLPGIGDDHERVLRQAESRRMAGPVFVAVFYLRRQIHERPRFATAGGAADEAQAAITAATGGQGLTVTTSLSGLTGHPTTTRSSCPRVVWVAAFADGLVFVDDLRRPDRGEVPDEAAFPLDDDGELARVAVQAAPVDEPALGELVEFTAAPRLLGGVFKDQLRPEGCFFGGNHWGRLPVGCGSRAVNPGNERRGGTVRGTADS